MSPPSEPGLVAIRDEEAGNGNAIGRIMGRAEAMSGNGDGSSVMSNGCFAAVGASAVEERRFPQRVLAVFLPSVISASPFKSLSLLFVQ